MAEQLVEGVTPRVVGVTEIDLEPSRDAVSPRGFLRAGEVWRMCQDVAVVASAAVGWPPERFVQERNAVVVRAMTVNHLREVGFGEHLRARTWVRDVRRDMLFRREVRLESQGELVIAASSGWVHVAQVGERGLGAYRPRRASADMRAAFVPVDHYDDRDVALPRLDGVDGAAEHVFEFVLWHTQVDPLGHANHPAYVDWCDEALSRILADRGVDPQLIQPVSEQVHYKGGAAGGEPLRVVSRLVARGSDGTALITHRITARDRAVARATTARRMADGSDLAALL